MMRGVGDMEEARQSGKSDRKEELGLYVHIPFCVKKCDYCDFLSAPATEEMKKNYIRALLSEIRSYRGKTNGYTVPTVFIGGGTPSAISASYIEKLMEEIRDTFLVDSDRLEATIEVNPGTVTREKLLAYQRAGINRLSFGLQSTDDRELKMLGRIHSYEEFRDNYELAREVGFHNINIDLMSSLPGQTVQTWENSLRTVTALKPEHISAYSLIIEEGTPFYERYGKGALHQGELPEEETDRLLYHRTKELLEESGYYRYEISNYARAGYECRHNSSYWIGTEYLGLGLGASSLFGGARFHNGNDIREYIRLCGEEDKADRLPVNLREEYKILTLKGRMEEFMFLGLRMIRGVSREEFRRRFSRNIDDVYGEEIKQLLTDHLLKAEGDWLALTEYGIDISNYVLSFFLLDE
jgi:oxygen-independent coproporphyrinogen-3 oxidase